MEGEVSGGRSCRVIVVFEVEENERLANNIETIDSEMNEPKRDSLSSFVILFPISLPSR